MPATADAYSALQDALRCPDCAGELTVTTLELRCRRCQAAWARPVDGHLDLRSAAVTADVTDWNRRQHETDTYYQRLRDTPVEAAHAFRADLAPLASTLSGCTGRVLDVGGGHGIVRSLLPPDAAYVSVDPSIGWLEPGWRTLSLDFPCLSTPLVFVRAVAERLPFADDTFDVVLCLWTLNHCARPCEALRQMVRVLRTGGRLVLVLEDPEPTWSELAAGSGAHYLMPSRWRLAMAKALASWGGWPVQSDHVAIRERDLSRWVSDLGPQKRAWAGCYLALEYERLPPREVPSRVEESARCCT
jgi:SAM-dependent methyltransferase